MASSRDLLAGIGVNTHLDATATAYGNVALVANSLAYLGVGLIRDHAYDIDLPAFEALASRGTRMDLIVDGGPQVEVASMIPLGSAVASFEGANEVDYQPTAGVTDTPRRAVAEQKLLYNTVKATPAFSNALVLNQSVSTPSNYAPYSGALAWADVATVHAYAASGLPPAGQIAPVVSVEDPARAKPVELTETGYYTLPSDPSGVDQTVQAKYTLDTLLDAFQAGISATFLYELFDEFADPAGTDSQQHYGLFNSDGSPKLAATAIHNFTQILGAPGAPNAPPLTLSPSLSGLPNSGQSLSLSGSNNSQFIAVWAEPAIWDPAARQEINVRVSAVTVDLGAVAVSVLVFNPMLGSAPIATYANVSSITLGLSDHPLLIEASAAPLPTPPAVQTPSATAPAPASTLATTTDVFRFFDTQHGTHFYSDSASEQAQIAASRPDLVYEGIGFDSIDPAIADPNAAPVYRFFEGTFGTHFYTASAVERDSIEASRPDLVFEGVGFIEHTTPQPGDAPVYRLFDTTYGTHFYTADAGERASVLATRPDLKDEGIAFFTPPLS